MANTYKTVIANAIKGFNDIQAKLASYSDLGISAISTSTTNGVTTVSNSITPATMVNSIGKMATIKKSDGSFISGKVTYRGNPGGTLKPKFEQDGTTITVEYSKNFSAGYYTSGTLTQTGDTYTIPSGSVNFTPSVSQLTYDGTSETALGTDILISTTPQSDQLANHYKVVMTPDSTSSVTDGYVTSSDVKVTGATNLVKYIKKGSVTSSVSGTNPTVTPSLSFSGSKGDYGITTTKPSGTDGTNYLTVTPGGSSNSQTFKAGMTLTAGYITAKGTEGTKSVKASIGTGTAEYIPIVTPAFDGGSVTAESGQLTVSDTDTDPGTGLLLTAKRSAVLYNGAKKGLISISDNTTARAADSNKYYVTKISLPAGKTLGSTSADGITINGASGSISKLYAGFAAAYGELHLKDTGGSSYKKVANNGKLITATPAFTGGTLSGGGLTATSGNVTTSTTNNGIYISVERAAVSRAAVTYNGAVDAWVTRSNGASALTAGSMSATSNTQYITGVTVPKDIPFSVAMTADTAADTTSNLTITNAAYRNVAITNTTNGTITINGGNADKGVLINGANGKTVTVDTTTVTDANGDLITTSVTGTPSVSSSGLTLSGTNTSGISVTGSGSASTGTGWISNGSWLNSATKYVTDITVPKSKTLKSLTLTSGSSDSRTYLTTLTVNGYTTISNLTLTGIITTLTNNSGIVETMGGSNNRITNMTGSTTVTNLGDSTTSATLTVSNNQYGTINIWGSSGDKTVQIANHTVTVDGTTVTNANGDLTTTSRSASTGYVTLTAGAGSVSGSNVTLSTTNNGISVSGSGTVSGVGYGKVSTGTGWITSGTTQSSNSSSSSLSSNTATKYITGVTVPKDIPFAVTMTADTAADTASNLTITNAAYRTIAINGGNADKGVLINGANGKTVTVDTTTVTNANGDLTTTSRSAGAGSITLTAGAGSASLSKSDYVSWGDTNNGISITATGSGTVSGVGKGTVSTGTGWVTNGSTTSNEASDSKSSNTATATKYITGITVPKDKTFSVTMTADTAADTTSNLTITNAAYRTIAINGGNANRGVLINGANGKTVTVDTTTVTDANGDLTTTSLSKSSNGATVTFSTGTGWITSSSDSVTIASGILSTSEATTDNAVPSGYAENSTISVPTKGWLLIGDGYYPKTAISLDTILGGKDDGTITPITAGYIRKDCIAYNIDGEKITGTMADWSPSSTYYTTTNTGYGVVTGGTYVTSTRYIKAASGWSSSGSVTTAPAVTISKSINSNITTSTTDAYGTGFLIAASASESNGTVQTKYSISTAGWTATKSSVNSGTVTVDPSVTNSYGNNYITKLTIPAGKSFGKYTSSSDYADGVTISGASGSIGALYAGFSAGYGDLYLRNSGGTSYTKVATSGKLTTTSRSASTGYVTLTAGAGSASLSKSDYVSWGDTNNGISITATGSGTVSGVGYGKVSTGTGWITSGTTQSSNSVSSSLSSNTATATKYITGITVPKDKTFSVTMTADTALSTSESLTVTNAAYRNINITTASNGRLTINSGSSAVGGATINHKTVSVSTGTASSSKTVTNSSGNLITANPTFTGGALSGGGLTVSDSNLDLSETNNGISFTVTRADVTRAVVEYAAAVDGWVTKSNGTDVLDAGTLSSGTLTRYITGVTVPKDKTFSVTMTADTSLDTTSNVSITNAAYRNLVITNAANGTITINGGAADKGVLINGANGKTVKVDNVQVTNANGDLTTTSVSFAGGTLSGSTSASASSSQLTLSDTDTDPGSGVLITASASGTAARAAMTYTNAAGWLSAHSGTSAIAASGNTAITGSSNKYYATALSLASGKSFAVTNAGTVNVSSNTGTINITNPSTGTVKYKNWNLKYDSTNDCIDFVFAQ